MANDSSRSAMIEREIEETRQHAELTMAALEGRLAPRRLAEDLLDYVRTNGRARRFAYSMRDAIAGNPGPLLLMAAGLGWLAYSSTRPRPAAPAYVPPSRHHVHLGATGRGAGTAPPAGQLIGARESGKSAAESATAFSGPSDVPHGEPRPPLLGPDGRPLRHEVGPHYR